MSNAITFRMASGIQGDIDRASMAKVEAQALSSAAPFASYGIPGKISGNAFVPITGSTDVVYGFLGRPYPTQGGAASDPLGTSTPPTTGIANIMKSGYMTVVNNAGTPALGGTVYVRYANAASGTPIGGLEATSVSGSNVAITGAQFTGAADANGNVEIAFNI